jgi:hypothetical protein
LKVSIRLQESNLQPFHFNINIEQKMTCAMKKAALVVALVTSFIAVFPLSIRLADPFFTFPFHKDWYHCVLLVWPGHVEARSFDDLAEVSPRPKDASYTFKVSPDRESWVKEQVRKLPSPNGNSSWTIRVKQHGASRQEIRLELVGDGIAGSFTKRSRTKLFHCAQGLVDQQERS